jgi:hypothetical protein
VLLLAVPTAAAVSAGTAAPAAAVCTLPSRWPAAGKAPCVHAVLLPVELALFSAVEIAAQAGQLALLPAGALLLALLLLLLLAALQVCVCCNAGNRRRCLFMASTL